MFGASAGSSRFRGQLSPDQFAVLKIRAQFRVVKLGESRFSTTIVGALSDSLSERLSVLVTVLLLALLLGLTAPHAVDHRLHAAWYEGRC